MKKLFLVFFLTLFNQFMFSQNQEVIDSLLLELKKSKRDTSQTHILKGLWRAYIDNDVEIAIDYANKIIDLGDYLDNESTKSSGYQRLGIAYAYVSDYENSNINYKKALEAYIKFNAYSPRAAMQLNIAMNFSEMGQMDSALYYNELAAKNFKIAKDYPGVAVTHDVNSGIYLDKSFYQLSLKEAITAAKIHDSINDDFNLSLTNTVIATNYLNLKDTLLAEKYFKEGLDYFTKNHNARRMIDNMVHLADIYINKGEFTKAKTMLDSSLLINKKLISPLRLSSLFSSYGTYYEKQKQKDSAIFYVKRGLKISDSLKLPKFSCLNLLKLAQLYETVNIKTSLDYVQKSMQIAKENNFLDHQKDGYLLLSNIHSQLNKYEAALDYYKSYKNVNDSIFNNETANKFSELKVIYETEKKEAEIALQQKEIKALNAEAKNQKLTKTIYGIGMFTFLAISGLLYFGFKQRMKKNKIAREKQEEIYKQEIEFKKKELASQTLHLVQKNTFIQELKDNLEKIKQSPELFKVEFRRLVMLLKKASAEDKDWEVFKSYFSEVRNNFDIKLKETYNDITEKEIRLASFLRMNLSTKEIASMLNVLPESVLKSKYRLKKKLGLEKDVELTQFLNTL